MERWSELGVGGAWIHCPFFKLWEKRRAYPLGENFSFWKNGPSCTSLVFFLTRIAENLIVLAFCGIHL